MMEMYINHIDQVGTQERVARLFSRSIKKESKIHALKTVLSMIDLTTLEGKDSPGKVKQLCYKAAHLHDQFPDLPTVAAICIYPTMVPIAKKVLEKTDINIAAVATAFPSGMIQYMDLQKLKQFSKTITFISVTRKYAYCLALDPVHWPGMLLVLISSLTAPVVFGPALTWKNTWRPERNGL